jgi:hypothetical protein
MLTESKTAEELEDVMAEKGYEHLGNGNFTAVYARPGSNKVIRIGTMEDTWHHYAALCMKTSNPHFPRIDKIGTRTGGDEKLLVARMERLLPISEPEVDFVHNNLPMIAFIALYIVQSMTQPHKDWTFAALKYFFRSQLQNTERFAGLSYEAGFKGWVDSEAMKLERPMAQALQMIKSIPYAQFDFKPDNFMRREDGTLVITDPIW